MPSANSPVAIRLDGETYDLIKVTGTEATFISRTSGEEATCHPADLADDNAPVRLVRKPRDILDLPPLAAQRVDEMADHIREVATGEWRDGTRRPRYDPETTSQETRIARKLEDLAAVGIVLSRRSMFRKLRDFRDSGRSGLIDGRTVRMYDPLAKASEEVRDVILEVLSQSNHQATRTTKYIIDTVHTKLRRLYGDDYPLPPVSTMYRWLTAYGQARNLRKSAATRSSAANRRDKTFTKNTEWYPGAEVQVDAHDVDIEVWVGDKLVRPKLSAMLDVATRMVLAVSLRTTATKGVDQAWLLAQAMTPRQNRPDISAIRAALDEQMPNHNLLPWDEYQRLAAAHPYIHPQRVMMDNGKEFKNSTVRGTAEFLGIDIVLSAPRTPSDKSHIERWFQTLETSFVQYLPGYIGGDPSKKGDTTRDKHLTLDMFRALLDDWLMSEYHQNPHEGLRHPTRPTVRISPLAKAAQATSDIAQFRTPLTQEMYKALLPTEYRVIGATGVKVGTVEFDSVELHPFRYRKSSDPRNKGKWPVKVDPYNPRIVWVEVAPGRLIECHERGSEYRHLQPQFEPAGDLERAQVAQFDAAQAGTPLTAPVASRLPEAGASLTDAEDEEDDFDYGEI